MSRVLVAGGGICGMVSALQLSKYYDEVILVEKEASCGGLFKSYRNKDGVEFDYGSHIAVETGDPDLDNILFGDLAEENWHIFRNRKVGNFFKNRLNSDSPNIDIRQLSSEQYRQSLEELLLAGDEPSNEVNLGSYIKQKFGKLLSDEVFEPIMQKFCGSDLSHLSVEAHRVLGPTRVVALTPEATREIKNSQRYGGKFSFHHYLEGSSPSRYYYPKQGGIGRWIDCLVQKLKDRGVKMRTGLSITKITDENEKLKSALLSNGEQIDFDLLVWTIFPSALSGLLNMNYRLEPPQFRVTTVVHFVFDRAFKVDLHNVVCYEPNMRTFRATLYSNIGEKPSLEPPFHASVESFSDTRPDPVDIERTLLNELKTMGIIDENAQVLFSEAQIFEKAWPVMSQSLIENTVKQEVGISSEYSNLLLLGKAKGHSFFMQDVLMESYRKIKSYHVQ